MSAPISSAADGGHTKQWDVRSLAFRIKEGQDWGLTLAQTAIARQILATLASSAGTASSAAPAASSAVPPAGLSFAEFRTVVAFLYKSGRDTTRVGEALDAYASAPSADAVRQWQQTLRGLFSPQGVDPYNLVVDGQWGKTTEEAMQYMIQAFHLAAKERSPDLLQQLREISERVVRVHCTDDSILLQLEHNPFCIIDNSQEAYELRTARKGGLALFSAANNQELIIFPDFFSAPKPGTAAFNRFSAWWMLLRLRSVASMAPNQIFLEDTELPRVSIDDLETGSKSDDFFLRPDRLLTLRSDQGKLKVDFLPPPNWGYRLICVFFTGDLGVQIYPDGVGELSYDFLKTKFVQPNRPPDMGGYINGQLQFRKKADFMKIFVIKDLTVNTAPHYGMAFPGIDQPAEFYAIIFSARYESRWSRSPT
jgi:hypothetical protein